jgi:hypothetical protein
MTDALAGAPGNNFFYPTHGFMEEGDMTVDSRIMARGKRGVGYRNDFENAVYAILAQLHDEIHLHPGAANRRN